MKTKHGFNLIPSPHDERDFNIDSLYKTKLELPNVLDYRSDLNPVRNQGSQDSCAAMTAAVMKEWQEHKELGFEKYMSPQFVYNLRPNKSNTEMTARDAMGILKKKGILPETIYPYGTTKKITDRLLDAAGNFKIQAYGKIDTLFTAKTNLLTNGPLFVGFPVYNEHNGEFWKQTHHNQELLGGHAVAIVGWLENAFIIRNSWGKNWGDGGYSYYPFDDWGVHWEVWGTIDDESCDEKLEEILNNVKDYKPKGCLTKIFGIF